MYLLLLIATLGQTKSTAALPDGPQRAIVIKSCAKCHDMAVVVARRRTREGWERSIGEMVARGAMGTDEEFEAVSDYLTTHFGKIDVNSAPADELSGFLGVSAEVAKGIVAGRAKVGRYKTVDQVKEAVKHSADAIEAKRAWIAFEP